MTGDIGYTGSVATYKMIRFINNATDGNGNGISIGGGGATIIGGGESASQCETLLNYGGDEVLYLANDAAIKFYTNCQSGISSAVCTVLEADGQLKLNRQLTLAGPTSDYNHLNVRDTTTEYHLYFGIGSGGINRGIYDYNFNRWVMYSDASASYFKGRADLATKAEITSRSFARDTSNATNLVTIYDTNNTTLRGLIGFHNTGGDGTGAAYIIPYPATTETWSGTEGLYIRKGELKIDNAIVLTSSNYNSYVPSKAGTGASGTWGISISGTAAKATADANGLNIANNYLKLSGGTMTGSISYKTTNFTSTPLCIYDDGTNYGHTLVIGGGGTTYLGAGESASDLYSHLGVKSTEDLYLGAENIHLCVNCNTASSHKGLVLDTALNLYPKTAYTGVIGTTSAPFNNGVFNVLTIYGATTDIMTASTTNPRIVFSEKGSQPVILAYSDYDNYRAPAGLKVIGGTSAAPAWFEAEGNIYGSAVYGAVWNDYAEFRETKEQIEAGRVVIENGDDTLSLATERLMPGANIVSDTFGFAIGETDNAKTPLAVSGRALVYTYEDRNSYKAGDPVCSGPNGTVSKMTREEVMMYPDRMIGTVSSIPNYETWGTGNVQINGRIWIRIR